MVRFKGTFDLFSNLPLGLGALPSSPYQAHAASSEELGNFQIVALSHGAKPCSDQF